MNKNYELAKNNQAINTYLANRQRGDQKQAGLYAALTSLPTIALTGYKMGKEAGLWGENKPSALEEAQTNYLNYLAGQNQPSLYDLGLYGTPNFDIFNYTGASAPSIPSTPSIPQNYVEPSPSGYGEGDLDWLNFFTGWF
jgi:hypothetical protein